MDESMIIAKLYQIWTIKAMWRLSESNDIILWCPIWAIQLYLSIDLYTPLVKKLIMLTL